MRLTTLYVALGVFLTAVQAFAQPYPSMANEATNGVYFQGGLSFGSSETGGAIGAAFSHDLSGRLGLEVAGGYLGRGPGVDAWNVSGSLLVYLREADEEVVPFLSAGAGMYRTSYDFGHPRFSGIWDDGAWNIGTFGRMYGPMHGWSRFADRALFPNRGPRPGNRVSFTDPAFPLGGGVRWSVSDRLSLRADARALVVVADRETFTVGLLTAGVGLRF